MWRYRTKSSDIADTSGAHSTRNFHCLFSTYLNEKTTSPKTDSTHIKPNLALLVLTKQL